MAFHSVKDIPREPTSFIGRRTLLVEIRDVLSRAPLVTLAGPGGVGKTRLIMQVARDQARTVRDGVWVADLSRVSAPDMVVRVVAAAMGVRTASERAPQVGLIARTRDAHGVLVLDNCEHVAEACAELLADLLVRAPAVRVLTTSRTPLGVPGEHVVRVPPLPLPSLAELTAPTPPDPMTHDAMRLFAERAEAAGAGELDPRAVGHLVRRLDGIPLAIELAAAWAATMSVPEILTRWDAGAGIRLLTEGAASTGAHHATLAEALRWSYDLCTEPERRVWERLSVFAGGFDMAASEAVCAGDGLAAEDIVDLVASLVQQSILIVDDRGSARTWYQMLDTLRAFGRDQLADAEPAYRLRHRDYYRRMAEEAAEDWYGPRDTDWADRLTRHLPNLRAAMNWSAQQAGQAAAGLAIAESLEWSPLWYVAGGLGEGRYWLRKLINRPEITDASVPQRRRALLAGTLIAVLQGDQDAAGRILTDYHEVTSQGRERGTQPDGHHDEDRIIPALLALVSGCHHLFSGRVADALPLLAQARDELRGAGRPGDTYVAGVMHAIAAALDTDPVTARAAAEWCATEASAHGGVWSQSWARWVTGLAELWHGEPGAADELILSALAAQHAIDDHWGIEWSVEARAWTANALGQHQRAADLLAVAGRLRELSGVDIAGLAPLDAIHRATVEDVRAAVGQSIYKAEWERAATLDYEAAAAVALPDRAPLSVAHPRRSTDVPDTTLTRREREVADLLGAEPGLTDRDISHRLQISIRTAESYIARILRKLGASKRGEISAWATEQHRQSLSSTSRGR